jgi:hypothetical protein
MRLYYARDHDEILLRYICMVLIMISIQLCECSFLLRDSKDVSINIERVFLEDQDGAQSDSTESDSNFGEGNLGVGDGSADNG